MNDTNPLTGLKAAWVVSDFNRRDRLLKTIRGKPTWIYHVLGVVWFIFIASILHTEEDNNTVLFTLPPLGLIIFGAHMDCSRRMNALIELIGEGNLRKPKTDDKEQNV